MGLYLRLAWRNLWRHRRRSMIVILSIAFTISLMIFYDGFVAGFNDAIYGNAIKVLGGNLQIHAQGYQASLDQNPLMILSNDLMALETVKAQPQVAGAARRIKTGGLATNREGAFAVSIVGIEPDAELPVNLVAQEVSAGRFLSTADQDKVYLGQGLATAMNLSVGDRITLSGSTAQKVMSTRTMTVVGIYDLGMAEIEKRTVYVSLAEAQNLYGLKGQSTEIVVYLHQLGQEQQVVKALKAALPGFEVTSWDANYPELKRAIESKGGVMNIFSAIMLMVAGIGILNLLLMAVFERTREIGILGALGMKPGGISILFLLEGAFMGVVGIGAGIVLGLAINFTLGKVGFDYSQFSSLTEYTALISGRIYPTLGLDRLVQRAGTALVIAILAAYYPARQAARQEPAESLHFV